MTGRAAFDAASGCGCPERESCLWEWLVRALLPMVVLYSVAAVAALALAWHARSGTRVSRSMVTGRAAIALGDSGAFAMHSAPPGISPRLALADAESAAVAYAYRLGPTHQVVRAREVVERPSERRHVCGRAYYVRPVVALPDSIARQRVSADLVLSFGASWVLPVCNDVGTARATIIVADAPTDLRVSLGDRPEDVPELVFPGPGHPPHIGFFFPDKFPTWERGVGLTPEAAVLVATEQLTPSGARVAEVPDAFAVVPSLSGLPHDSLFQSMIQPQSSARWRLTLDRPVRLRGVSSGQVVTTRTVYVARGTSGTDEVVSVQIPRPAQPHTILFHYIVPTGIHVPGAENRLTAIRVIEPLWFEPARLLAGASR
jgi:hypothetical protein